MRLRVYLFFLAIYCLTTAGHIYTIDSLLSYQVTRSLADRGTLAIPRFMMTVEGIDGRHYSKLGIGQSIVGLPFYLVGKIFERFGIEIFGVYSKQFLVPEDGTPVVCEPQSIVRISETEGTRVFFVVLANCFVCAGVCLLFWSLLQIFGVDPLRGFLASIVLGFSTPMWMYSRDFFSEPLFTFALLGTLIFIVGENTSHLRAILLASFFSNIGILARLTFIPIVLILAGYIFFTRGKGREASKQALLYTLGVAPSVVAIAILNFKRFGGVALTGYHTAFDKGFSVPLVKGLVWNFFSPYRGLFIYAPSALILFFGVRNFYAKWRSKLVLLLSISAVEILIYSKWWAWHGGWCWGPRFLIPLLPLFLLIGFAGRSCGKRSFSILVAVLFLIGFVFQLSSITINYTAIYDYWIKIGRLDWAEARIEMLFPLLLHLRAMFATHPSNYDVWVVQAVRQSPWAWLWLLGWLWVAIFCVTGMIKYFRGKALLQG